MIPKNAFNEKEFDCSYYQPKIHQYSNSGKISPNLHLNNSFSYEKSPNADYSDINSASQKIKAENIVIIQLLHNAYTRRNKNKKSDNSI